MKLKTLKVTLAFIGILITFVSVTFAYITTNGFTNYVSFCSQYIPLIESYNQKHGRLPEQLSNLDNPSSLFWHNPQKCSYNIQNDSYGFYVPHGLVGIAIYSSNWGKWQYD